MSNANTNKQPGRTTLDIISAYWSALAAGDGARMSDLHGEDYVLDLVHRDAFASKPISDERTSTFWPSWFDSFSDMDYQVARTIAAESMAITEWIFRGAHTGPITPPVFERRMAATGRTIQFRGATFYDIQHGLIQRETIYLDLGTVLVELGVML